MTATISRHFSASYGEARKKFLDAAKAAGAGLTSHQNTEANGPRGEPLYTDVARIGAAPGEARAVIFINSGTHGIEGYCGSGCQVGALREELFDGLAEDVAIVFTHAVNPYGFCWGRRTNESNIDLNRNYVDHEAPYPDDTSYRGIHGLLCPPDLMDRKEEYDAKIFEWIGENGLPAFQEAVSSGQYSHPDGLFYGGNAPAWSNLNWRRILKEHGAGAGKVIFIDLHTDLGPSGVGELIGLGDAAHVQNAYSIWGEDDVTDLQGGTSSSAVVRGDMSTPFFASFPDAWTAAAALEYGTLDIMEVLEGLRQETWLHFHGDRDSALGREIEARNRAAFYTETDEWKQMIWDRASHVFTRAREVAES